MQGKRPMLPVQAAENNIEGSFEKSHDRGEKNSANTGSCEVAAVRRTSTIAIESTIIQRSDEEPVNRAANVTHHQRDLSLITGFDLARATQQLKHEEISDLDLALFAFWIKASDSNYARAKALIRELALDQGYNINKITNQRVRKLLQEVHDIRPRDPHFAPVRSSSLHDQTQTSGVRSSNGIRAVTSPLAARLDVLPPWLRLKREKAVREAARPTMPASDAVKYPPNTPDRPAPLSVKSRSSQISNSTPVSERLLRSISTPIRIRGKEDMAPSSENLPSSTAETRGTPRTYYASATEPLREQNGDIFHDRESEPQGTANSFTVRLNNSGDKRYGTPGRYMHNESTTHSPTEQYQLNASDVASNSSCETCNIAISKSQQCSSNHPAYDTDLIGDDTFDGLESYVSTEDEDERSVLESASTDSGEAGRTLYQFDAHAYMPRYDPVISRAPRPPERRAAAESRRRAQEPGSQAPTLNLHRCLPLRSYESEVAICSTDGAQADAGFSRSKSVTSIVNRPRCAMKAMQHSNLLRQGLSCSGSYYNGHKSPEKDNLHNRGSEKIGEGPMSLFQHPSPTTTLASFPIPPMVNPVGELPILISRVATSPPASCSVSSQHSMTSTSLEDTYRAITKVNMTAVLQRTRARGKQLCVVDWEKLDSFEQAWRKVNEALLVTIYGRQDVSLDASDISYVDCVARELRNAPDDTDPMAWVRRMFEDCV